MFVNCDLFDNSYYEWHHIVTLIYSSLMVNNSSIFSSACWPYVFFGKKVYSGHFLIKLFVFFYVQLYELFIYLRY